MLSALLAVAVLLNGVAVESPNTDPVTIQCVPGRHAVANYFPVLISVGTTETLYGKFYYPFAGDGYQFASGSLPGVAMTHGFGAGYPEVEDQAQQLAENCFVVLIYNYRGQGWDWEVSTQFSFYTEAERDDLYFVVSELKKGPIEGTLDLVDDARLGMLGFSQGGIATWRALADPALRGKFKAVAPSDSAPDISAVQLPNGCSLASLANLLDPARLKPTWPPGQATPTTQPTPQPPYPPSAGGGAL